MWVWNFPAMAASFGISWASNLIEQVVAPDSALVDAG